MVYNVNMSIWIESRFYFNFNKSTTKTHNVLNFKTKKSAEDPDRVIVMPIYHLDVLFLINS